MAATMTINKTDVLSLLTEHDIVMARQGVRKLTQEIGFGIVDQTKMVTAASELARNAVVYGRGGEMRCEVTVRRRPQGPAPALHR